MRLDLIQTRFQKLLISLTHFSCWRPLMLGVLPSAEHMKLLRTLEVDGIMDVGANRGQFTLACRLCQPTVKVIAFEPISFEADTFDRVHRDAKLVEMVRCGLGEEPGTQNFHVSQKADSSSVLPIGQRQVELFPDTKESNRLLVQIDRLDSYLNRWSNHEKLLLKIDVQGFELQVLKGALDILRKCRYVYVECSEVELYEGQALRHDVSAFLADNGFREIGRYNEMREKNELIQADYLFENAS